MNTVLGRLRPLLILLIMLSSSACDLHAQGSKKAARPAGSATARTMKPNPVAPRPGPQGHSFGNNAGSAARNQPHGTSNLHTANGDLQMRGGGRGPMDFHGRDVDMHHNLNGGHRIEARRADGSHLVYERGRAGYIGHPYNVRGHEFERRTYYDHGRAYDRYYRPYRFHGYDMRVYAPARYFPGAYYGWAYRPWGYPARYDWRFGGTPWYGAYGAYFTPYPVYASPSLWITDYMLSQTLAAAYQAQVEGGDGGAQTAAYSGPPIPPEAKQAIANEVQSDIALENQESAMDQQQGAPDPASSGIGRLTTDGRPHAFVAGREVDVVDSSGLECSITDGDVVELQTPPGPNDTTVNVIVMASKGGKDCQRGAQVAIGLDELQEMNNHLREQVDAGMQQLATEQGTNGLPAAPQSALAAASTATVAQDAPPPDPNGAQELQQQDAQAQQAERQALASAGASAQQSLAGNPN